MQAQKTAVPPL